MVAGLVVFAIHPSRIEAQATANINATFGTPAYYPLVKERIGLFEEFGSLYTGTGNTLGETQLLTNLQQVLTGTRATPPALPISSFRALGSFLPSTPFNVATYGNGSNPPQSQVYTNGSSQDYGVDMNTNLITAFTTMHSANILPIMTFSGTPVPMQSGSGDHTIPPSTTTFMPGSTTVTAMEAYGNAMSTLANDYVAQSGPLTWEVWNEPDLSFAMNEPTLGARLSNYISIYQQVASSLASATVNGDLAIAAPAFSTAADTGTSSGDPFEYFVSNYRNSASPNTPQPDYLSFHSYGTPAYASTKFSNIRQVVQDQFNTSPFLLTEYENYKTGDSTNDPNRDLTVGAIAFLDHVAMLVQNTDIAAVNWNRFMDLNPTAGQNGTSIGGWLTYNNGAGTTGQVRAIYNAAELYDWMPAEQTLNAMHGATDSDPAPAGLNVLTASEPHEAGILVWNEAVTNANNQTSCTAQTVNYSWSGLGFDQSNPDAMLNVYRIDQSVNSIGDGAPTPNNVMALANQYPLNGLGGQKILSIPCPGIALLLLQDGSGISRETRPFYAGMQYRRSWAWAPRVELGGLWQSQGNYGTFDPASWILRVGNNTTGGRGIAGVTLTQAPTSMTIKYTNSSPVNPDVQTGTQTFMAYDLEALRVDYWNGSSYDGSVMFYGGPSSTNPYFNSSRNSTLPWGAGGATGTKTVYEARMGTGTNFTINIDTNAPSDWNTTDRRILISAWMQGMGQGAQSVVELSLPTDPAP